MSEILITKELALKVKEVVSHGLSKGLGVPELGKMCIEAAVNYACDLPHSDNPTCVGSAVRRFKIALNDKNWSSNAARAEGMKKIAIAQLGSNKIDQIQFIKIIALKTITILLPTLLRELKLDEKDAKLSESSKNLKEGKDNCKIVRNKLRAADAAYAAAYAADAAAYAADAASINKDKYLKISAQICLEALIELKSEGCQFLYLVEDN